MAEAGLGRLPVVSTDDPKKVIGMVTRSDLLKPRARQVAEETQRESFFGLLWSSGRQKRKSK
jgi:CBS-domain-containing membrane protein